MLMSPDGPTTQPSGLPESSYQQARPNLCSSNANWVFCIGMDGSREESAVGRIEAALNRIQAATEKLALASGNRDGSNHTLRNEVAATLRDLDELIESIER